ncbi:HAMP domain-containing sensor histidine kinase [Micromonospora sp. FIMYZ51]|uniref:sensor histidine kinase n=1 Tax=Micromonospora sp. FIMYZ51 TaxID=3051832 RepID=UPI0031201F03
MRGRYGLARLLRTLGRTGGRIGPGGLGHTGGRIGDDDPPGPAAPADLLLRVLCHELRTPVSSLTALTRALADETAALTEDDRRAVVALARDQATHLAALLDEAATSVSGLTLAARRDEPRAPLVEILPTVAALVPAERRRILVTPQAARCPAPARRTRQVLGNLIENALRHGPPAGRIGIRAVHRRGGLSLSVTDEGRAADALVEALRRPLPAVGMSGLGLWIVRELAAADGGQLRLHRLRPYGIALEVLLPGVHPIR